MATTTNPLVRELHDLSSLTGVKWSAWLTRSERWSLSASYRLAPAQKKNLEGYLNRPKISRWLDESFHKGESRPRHVPPELGLDDVGVHVFPDEMTCRVILVGAAALTPTAKRFWQAAVSGGVGQSPPFSAALKYRSGADFSIPYYLPEALERILHACMEILSAENGWLSVRAGDFLEIKARVNCAGVEINSRLSIDAIPDLADAIQTRRKVLLHRSGKHWPAARTLGMTEEIRSVLLMPLAVGKRVIGLLALGTKGEPTAESLATLDPLAESISFSVESNAVFTDLSAHLHRMALLNDFVRTISTTQEVAQIAQRMFALLGRAFNTSRINLIVVSADERNAQQFITREQAVFSETVPFDVIHAAWMNEKGQVYHPATLSPSDRYLPAYRDSRSVLVVPLRYRRRLIGLLALESEKEVAFSVADEHLLVVIASQLTSLFENSRLRVVAEQRADNLALIHDVVERVIGITDSWQVAQLAADLIAKNFSYELVIVLLKDPDRGSGLNVAGIGGNAANAVTQGLRKQDPEKGWAIAFKVADSGKNILIDDLGNNPDNPPLALWSSGSAMCVALRDSGNLYGVIEVRSQKKNAFSQSEMLVLESLAGILSSVFSNVERFDQLKTTVAQLNLAREELQARITAQKLTESRLVQAAKLAAVGEMAAGIAHELNNPLTTVAGFTELVLQELPDQSGARADLELVLKESQRARTVVRRLLDFARQSESTRIRSDMNEVLEEVVSLVNHLLHTNGIELRMNFASGLPWVRIDRNQIKQVALNLIHNAMHAMPRGGNLVIATSCQKRDRKSWITFQIQDDGVGIPADQIEKIFEPFYTTRSTVGGTGLGLSVSYGIVADHGGFIEVESQPERGSRFMVWLPVEG
jgi:signal transduction histidine kinase